MYLSTLSGSGAQRYSRVPACSLLLLCLGADGADGAHVVKMGPEEPFQSSRQLRARADPTSARGNDAQTVGIASTARTPPDET